MEREIEPKLCDTLVGLSTINEDVVLFKFGNVLLRKDYENLAGLRIISGCAPGYEPLAAGFVGAGMLTAAVQGQDQVAPTSKLILRTIRELSINHFGGLLVIIPGDSGILLNFGLAVERAVNDGLNVKMLVVADDCANKYLRKSARRGLTGVVLLYKIAGAMADMGKPLEEIYCFCDSVVQNMTSTFISTNFCTATALRPKCGCDHAHDNGGEHNEEHEESNNGDNNKKIKTYTINDICKDMIDNLLQLDGDTFFEPGKSLIVLLNNVNGLSKADELILIKELVSYFLNLDITIERFYTGCFMSYPNMSGLTFTVLKTFDEELMFYLNATCLIPAWSQCNQTEKLSLKLPLSGKLRRKDRLSPPIKGLKLTDEQSRLLEMSVFFACDALISCEWQLNLFDEENGDADAGTRLKMTGEVLKKRIRSKKLVTTHPFTFFESLSKVLESSIGGTAGCIYSIIFEAAAKAFMDYDDEAVLNPQMLLDALETAVEAVKKYGNVQFGDFTLYDPLYGCLQTIKQELEGNSTDFMQAFSKGVAAAEEIAKAKQEDCKYPDSGAHAVGIWMRAVLESIKLKCS